MNSVASKAPYAGHRFPAEVISHAVWLYFRFPLSLRMVEEMLAARGVVVSHETVRRWALKFGQEFASRIRRRLPCAGDKWHLDEVVILSANSGGLFQGGEAGHARLGTGPSVEPVHHSGHVHRSCGADLLQPGLRQTDVSALAHTKGADTL
jgi:hypothetical protein